VAFPAFAKLPHHKDQLFEQLLSFTRLNLVVMIAFLSAVLICSEEVLLLFSGGDGMDFSTFALRIDPLSSVTFFSATEVDYVVAAPAVRILCGVAVLRALSFVLPPFLDGVGRPTLTLVYTAIASVLLPALFLIFALTLDDELGYLSVAVAWVVGYPVAFVVLLWMALTILDVGLGRYLSRIYGIVVCGAAALPLGFAVKYAAAALPAAIRFALVAGLMLPLFFVLLARFQGISPRTVLRSFKK